MSESGDRTRRQRRRRPRPPSAPPPTGRPTAEHTTAEHTNPEHHPVPAPPPAPSPPRPSGGSKRRRRAKPDKGERAEPGLRDIVGAGPSQLGVDRALRARDVNRPTAADIAAAEREVVLVRRHWHPPTHRTN